MKRYGHLFEQIIDYETLDLAITQAAHGKSNRKVVQKVIHNRNFYIMKIQDALISGEYKPSHVKGTKIHERGKDRIITSSPFYPDQIIHWAIAMVIEPIMYKSMYQYCIATVKGKGGGFGRKAIEKWLRRDVKNTKYCLKMDIHHFYQNIDHNILKQKLSKRFKDEQLLLLLYSIIDCYDEGLPLGLYTSQWLANFYLESLDHQIKEKWHAKYYVRYMDDMVVLGPNKKKLHRLRKLIDSKLREDVLVMKSNWQVFPINSRPIDFLGFKFYRDHTSIRRCIFLKMRRKVAKISKKSMPSTHDARSLLSYWGWIKHSDSFEFYNEQIKPKFNVKNAKEVLKNAKDVRKDVS